VEVLLESVGCQASVLAAGAGLALFAWLTHYRPTLRSQRMRRYGKMALRWLADFFSVRSAHLAERQPFHFVGSPLPESGRPGWR
jgi:hypothetical protein